MANFDGYFPDPVKQYLQPLADVGVERVGPGFVKLLKTYDPRKIREIVKTSFPQWLEELDKLLIIK